MTKYFKQEDAIKSFMRYIWYDDFGRAVDNNDEKREILNDMFSAIPVANVVEVKDGKWMPHIITRGRSSYFCSICKKMVDIPASFMIHRFHYCPYCGAKMMEE